jgi:hypothetical protein
LAATVAPPFPRRKPRAPEAQTRINWTFPRRTLGFVERKEQCADAKEFAKSVQSQSRFSGKKNLLTNALPPQNCYLLFFSFVQKVLPEVEKQPNNSAFPKTRQT